MVAQKAHTVCLERIGKGYHLVVVDSLEAVVMVG